MWPNALSIPRQEELQRTYGHANTNHTEPLPFRAWLPDRLKTRAAFTGQLG